MKTIALTIITALLPLFGSSLAGEKLSALRIATQPIPLYGPIFVAKRLHWLEDELAPRGIEVKWTSFVAGPPENESFFAGQQDIGFIGDTPAIIARSAGLDTRVIGTASIGPKALAVVVQKDSGIVDVAGLKGRKVAVTKGSYAHHLLELALVKGGLANRDVKLIHLAPADLVSAFTRGDVDAASTWEVFLGRIEGGEVGGRRIADGSTLNKQGAVVILAIDSFAKANPEIIDLLLKTYIRWLKYIKENPVEAAKHVGAESGVLPEVIEKLFPIVDFTPNIPPEIVAELKLTEGFLREEKLSGPVDIDAFVDVSYLKAAGIQK